MQTIITRSDIIAKLLEWQEGKLTAEDLNNWAVRFYLHDDVDYSDWEGDEEERSVTNEVLAQLDSIDMNLMIPDDVPAYLEFLDTPLGKFEDGYAKLESYLNSIDYKERARLLAGNEFYAPFCSMETLDLFKDLTSAFLESYPQIRYEWVERGEVVGINIPKQEENGFNVFWGFDRFEIYFEAGDIHHSSITLEHQTSPEKEIRYHLGFLRDLLSNKMRIVEKYAGKTPYKMQVQNWDGQQWQTEDIVGSVFYNYFAKKSERTYQNNILEGKEIHNNSK